ncbi:MAG: alkaline phosphatase family protein [Alphaproteobacteria bacterium]|nr:alkaline phosphatase family protein [Alphaproteobacteria bacterium]
MQTPVHIALGALLGALLGAVWWAAYVPTAYPLGILLGAHAAGGAALAAGLSALGAEARRGPPLVLALLFGGVVVPAALPPVYQAGLVGGKAGAVVFALAALVGVGLGAGVGLAWVRGSRAIALGAAALGLGGAAGVFLTGQGAIPDESQPTAQPAATRFPQAPVMVFGIDGGDWRVMDPLLERGELPNLAALIARGRHGVLRSMEPMASPVIWTTIFTGMTPEGHGLVDWNRSDARSRRVPMLWDIFGAHARSSLTVNVPGSWPPHPVLYGRLISGFPIPGLTSGDTGHLLGRVVTTEDSGGLVPTTVAQGGDGAFTATLPLAIPEIAPRVPGVRSVLIDQLAMQSLLPVNGDTLSLQVSTDAHGAEVRGDFEAAAVRLSVGGWSPWLEVRRAGLVCWIRLYLMEAGPQRLTLFVSPAFQDPRAPRHPYQTGVDPEALVTGEGPYVVEGLGWIAHRDPRVARLVPDMIFEVQQTQVEAADRLLAGGPVDLLSFVYTATDRLQHPFWPLHDASEYGEWSPPDTVKGLDPVVDAYRQADDALGRLLQRMPEDTLVFIVSDHGADPHDGHMDEGEAGHRLTGIWIAAGPGVPADPERLEMSVVDVTPTVLHCAGAPVAQDFEGAAVGAVCPEVGAAGPVASYIGDAGSATEAGEEVDAEQVEQIRALGYMD